MPVISELMARIFAVTTAVLLVATLVLGVLLKRSYEHSGVLQGQVEHHVSALKTCGDENKKLRQSTKMADTLVENASQEKRAIQQGTINVIYKIQQNTKKEVDGACITNVLDANLDPDTDRVLREEYSRLQKRAGVPPK